MRDGDDVVEFENVTCSKETDKALLVEIEGEEYWIPKSHIADESEVKDEDEHNEGTLVISAWIAREKGLS